MSNSSIDQDHNDSGSQLLGDSGIILAVLYGYGEFVITFYNKNTYTLQFLPLVQTDVSYFLQKVIEELRPEVVIYPANISNEILLQLNHAIELTSYGRLVQFTASKFSEIIPFRNFEAILNALDNLKTVNFTFIPASLSPDERLLAIKSLFPNEHELLIRCVGGLLTYLSEESTHNNAPEFFRSITILDVQMYSTSEYTYVDDKTLRTLNIFHMKSLENAANRRQAQENGFDLTLYKLINLCHTVHGKKLLQNWIRFPIKDIGTISERLDAIDALVKPSRRDIILSIRSMLRNIGNFSKILLRMQESSALLNDWRSFYKSLQAMKNIYSFCQPISHSLYPMRNWKEDDQSLIDDIYSWIVSIVDFEMMQKNRRFSVKSGINTKLDEWGRIYRFLPDLLTQLAEGELSKLQGNIQSCALIYFPLFTDTEVAYYRNATTEDAETSIMHSLQNRILKHSQVLLRAQCLAAELDCLCSLAMASITMNGVRPDLVSSRVINIENSWHPLHQATSSNTVRNTFYSDADSLDSTTIVTGPNASGKSVYLNQIGIVIYLAHIGCYVPAERAVLGPMDAIYNLSGCEEEEHEDKSGLVVSLIQASRAMHNQKGQSSSSLILMDEFADSFDEDETAALTIAMLEHFINANHSPHVVVATHNYTFVRLLTGQTGVRFITMKTREENGMLAFLYEARTGKSAHSYAICAANRAGMPDKVLRRAMEVKRLVVNLIFTFSCKNHQTHFPRVTVKKKKTMCK